MRGLKPLQLEGEHRGVGSGPHHGLFWLDLLARHILIFTLSAIGYILYPKAL